VSSFLYADLGRVRYGLALKLQRHLHRLRRDGRIRDTVLALEHDPVITIGRGGTEAHILAPPETLASFGVEIVAIERGGDVTYHGPGQLVLYPILDLRGRGKDLHRYVADLEEIMIRIARSLGVEAERRRGFPGVWHERGKLGAVGIHVRDWVTMHGLALNVDLDPDGFQWIIPCGIAGAKAVSIADTLDRPVSMGEAWVAARAAVSDVLGEEIRPASEEVIAAWMSESLTG